MRRRLASLSAGLLLIACDGGGDTVQQALRETSAANHAATVKETASVASASPAASRETTSDQAYVNEMIGHHRRAIAVAKEALATSHDPKVRRMAQAAIDTRAREMAELRAWEPASAQSADR